MAAARAAAAAADAPRRPNMPPSQPVVVAVRALKEATAPPSSPRRRSFARADRRRRRAIETAAASRVAGCRLRSRVSSMLARGCPHSPKTAGRCHAPLPPLAGAPSSSSSRTRRLGCRVDALHHHDHDAS
ncbi:hypothetical protein Dimus_037747, partial [Dionaea muscipula]